MSDTIKQHSSYSSEIRKKIQEFWNCKKLLIKENNKDFARNERIMKSLLILVIAAFTLWF